MLLTLSIFLHSIHQPTNALNDMHFMTSIKLLHVSARGCQHKEFFKIKGTEVKHAKVGTASPSQKLLKYH